MTQKSKAQRERRRRKWYDEERPTLLVRLRLVSSAASVDAWKDTKFSDRHDLRAWVAYREKSTLFNVDERSQ